MTTKQVLMTIAERIRKDKASCASYVDEGARRLAHVTLDALVHNIAHELYARDVFDNLDNNEFVAACGPTYAERAS